MGDKQVDGVVLRPSGDIDVASVAAFRTQVDMALLEEPPALVLDLTDVPFMDSSGIAVLAVALREQSARGAVLAVTHEAPIVRKAVELVGLGMLFDTSQVPPALVD